MRLIPKIGAMLGSPSREPASLLPAHTTLLPNLIPSLIFSGPLAFRGNLHSIMLAWHPKGGMDN